MADARIFVSYSHHGAGPEWRDALLRSLHVFARQGLLDVWQDGRIRVGSLWDGDIHQAMLASRLAVVLITKEALESEYILKTEFPVLRERQQSGQLLVFPVICEECDWQAHPWLRATQAANGSNPLSRLSQAGQDRVFRKLAADIAAALGRLALAELPSPEQSPGDPSIYLDKFPLTHSGGPPQTLEGREQELALLDLAFAQPHTAIVSLVARGRRGQDDARPRLATAPGSRSLVRRSPRLCVELLQPRHQGRPAGIGRPLPGPCPSVVRCAV